MKDERFCNSNCPFTRAIGTIGNKWKPIIINVIGTRSIRFGKLDAIVPHISRKVLTEQLKELEEDGLLERIAYKEIPPRVEYRLSEKGLAFLPILESIKEWNLKYEVALMPKETDYSYAG
jgi:DNA-binding HxlR family transcriptional regulator